METLDQSIKFSWNVNVESAYIITIKDHPVSEAMSRRCAESCDRVGMPWKKWDAFDGTKGQISVPEHCKEKSWLKWIKVVNCALAKTEICNVLSHVALWAHCVEIDQPIVILEHDAIMIEKVLEHPAINAILYLGSIEQVKNDMYSNPIPIMGQLNENYRFILRTHAYSVDPIMARRLLSNLLMNGLTTSIDVYIRSDIFTQIQMGVRAFDKADGMSTSPEKTEKQNDPHLLRINNKIL